MSIGKEENILSELNVLTTEWVEAVYEHTLKSLSK